MEQILVQRSVTKKYVGNFGHTPNLLEVYLPWRGFNGRDNKFPPYYIANKLSGYEKTMQIAEQTHPAWERCSRGAKGLHRRNVNQVLGFDISTPVKFLICWAKPKGLDGLTVNGGTNTAVQLAHQHGAKIFNLYYPEVKSRLEKWIKVEGTSYNENSS